MSQQLATMAPKKTDTFLLWKLQLTPQLHYLCFFFLNGIVLRLQT